MFDKVLIANRGEIALRIQRACRAWDRHGGRAFDGGRGRHARAACGRERVHRLGSGVGQLSQTYPRLLAACEITGADAVHPGYGFLSENARFAEILEEHSITFIGPTSEHIRIMGDKIEAKETAKRLGIPVVPGSDGAVESEADAMRVAKGMGFPVLIKATAGGGGRGMKVAHSAADLGLALSTAKAEAKAAFGNDAVYIEKYLTKPRHIEIQCSATGRAMPSTLGERDCSLQRRHQMVLEESPRPPSMRRRARKSARRSRRRCARSSIAARAPSSPLRGRRVLLH